MPDYPCSGSTSLMQLLSSSGLRTLLPASILIKRITGVMKFVLYKQCWEESSKFRQPPGIYLMILLTFSRPVPEDPWAERGEREGVSLSLGYS